ncbi:hypothetical protein UYSO10_2629 [Kosakonia radicincitans]|nr:hypothetical protein UYSO10_2629 [Kosakonia radicincitans]
MHYHSFHFTTLLTPYLYYTFAQPLCENSNMAFSTLRTIFDENSESKPDFDKKILSPRMWEKIGRTRRIRMSYLS